MRIIKATQNSEPGVMPSTELLTAMGQYNEALAGASLLLSGEGLQPSAWGRRVGISPGAPSVTNGPFEPVSELVAGFWIWPVSSMDDVPEGEVTLFAKAVKKQDDEAVVLGCILWPSRGARDEGRPKAMADARLSEEANPMPFDGSRLIYGGFETIVER